jgi:hypothetical protein
MKTRPRAGGRCSRTVRRSLRMDETRTIYWKNQEFFMAGPGTKFGAHANRLRMRAGGRG